MKKLLFLTILSLFSISNFSQIGLDYYLPGDVEYNYDIPTPKTVFGHEIGEWYLTHDKLVNYMKVLAEASDRISMKEYGRTYENRPLYLLTISSPENINNIEKIRKEHLRLTDHEVSGDLDVEDMPAFVWMGYSIHGNEPSGGNCAPIVAYYYAAAEGSEIEELLESTVILLDPCLNPDGFTRFSTWGNMHKSKTLVTDPSTRGGSEFWPGGRTNHYWFDLNRDWLLAQQPETQGRLNVFHKWKPNILTDHHEMGSNSTFFFQPGIPSRNNPLTPGNTFLLTHEVAKFHAKSLDKIGSLYYSEETFDDFYFGKGSSYPDINGCIGILFEQASTRRPAVETSTGIRKMEFGIRNQFTVSLSSVDAAYKLRKKLLNHQRDFYSSARELANNENFSGYIFGNRYDMARNYHFIELLKSHNIKVLKMAEDLEIDGENYPKNKSYFVPLDQPEYRLVKTLFQQVKEYSDSSFYDVSAWTVPLAFNIPYAKVEKTRSNENIFDGVLYANYFPKGEVKGNSDCYAYMFKWDEYYAPKALNILLSHGLMVKLAGKSFTYSDEELYEYFSYGNLMLPTGNQKMSKEQIHKLLDVVAEKTGVDFIALKTGLTTDGPDLGSGSFSILRKPEILMFVEGSVSSREAGEIWHLLDQRYEMQVSLVDINRYSQLDLNRYNTIIMPGGSYNQIDQDSEIKLKNWLRTGGTIIAFGSANSWLNERKFITLNYKQEKTDKEIETYKYSERSKYSRGTRISGVILKATLDITHPIGYGYHSTDLPVIISSSRFVERTLSPYSTPLVYKDDPLMSGFVPYGKTKIIRNSASILVNSSNGGKIISFLDNPNFRGYWYGTSKLVANAIFFGHVIK